MRYYIQDSRSYLGDAVMWWRPNGEGYTSLIDEAGEYEEAEAMRICRDRSTEKAIPVDVARAATVRVVYAGHLHRAKERAAILSILRHALGRDEFGRRRKGRDDDYRNHFCAGDDDLPTCREAAAQGLMVEHAAREISGGFPIFVVTDAGKAYIAEHSPPPPKVSRGKARYLRWLSIADAVGMTFGEWLKGGAQ